MVGSHWCWYPDAISVECWTAEPRWSKFHIEADDRTRKPVCDEGRHVLPFINNRHIPRPVNAVAGDGLNNITVRIQEQETARRRSAAHAIGARKTGHQYEAGVQDTEARRKALLLRVALEEDRPLPVGLNPDDGGSGALQVLSVVEVGDQNIAGVKSVSRKSATACCG